MRRRIMLVAAILAVGFLLPGCTDGTVRNTPYGMYDNRNTRLDNNRGYNMTDGLTTYENPLDYTVDYYDQDLSNRIITQGTPRVANPNTTTAIPRTATTSNTTATTPNTATTTPRTNTTTAGTTKTTTR